MMLCPIMAKSAELENRGEPFEMDDTRTLCPSARLGGSLHNLLTWAAIVI